MRPPVVVLGPPRSGTSMTAGTFAKHGVWTGTCRTANKHNPRGFYESVPLQEIMMRHWGPLVHAAREGEYVDGVASEIEAAIRGDGYTDGPWLAKCSSLYWRMYLDLSPTYVLCRRDPEATIRSGKATGYNSNAASVHLHNEVMDRIREQHDGIDVDTDAVVAGDYATLEAAFDAAGLDFDRSIADAFIDPDLWKHGRSAA